MALEDEIKAIAGRIPTIKDRLATEEATKQSLVLPFLQALGYNVFDPTEVWHEFTADVGTKQGEKVDYALMSGDAPVILIECKKVSDNLSADSKVSQLFRYFGTTQTRIGVLTNGVLYQFFSDLESPNVMGTSPFLEVDLEKLDVAALEQLGKFAKGFDVDETVEGASHLRYINGMKKALTQQFNQPEDDFVEWLGRRVYSGRMTQTAKDKFSQLTRRAFHEFVNDRITDTLRAAQSLTRPPEDEIAAEHSGPAGEESDRGDRTVITTALELQAYNIVKDIILDTVNPERVAIRDSQSYCAILLDDNNRLPLCRLYLDARQKQIGLFDGSRYSSGSLVDKRSPIESINDIYKYSEQILETVRRYLESSAE